MTDNNENKRRIHFLNKVELRELIEQQNALTGFVPDAKATGEHAQAMMLALGIRPEDNIGSCGILAARETE